MRKLVLTAFMALAFILIFSACNGDDSSTGKPAMPSKETTMESVYNTISPSQAKKLIGSDGVLLVDVRTKDEYVAGYIPGAVLLPLDDIPQQAESVLPDKGATIIIYCRSGRRSAIAAEELLNMGYKNVYDLGGILDWPYETTS